MDPNISIVVALGAFFIWALVIYSRLVALRNRVSIALAQLHEQLTRRHQLVTNLLATAAAHMAHERETLEAVTVARDKAQAAAGAASGSPADGQAMAAMAQAEGTLSSRLNRFLALAETHPDLKADETLMRFSGEITTIENRLSSARQAFNDAVMHFNAALQAFPAVMFAHTLGFKPAATLEPLDSDLQRREPAGRL